MFSREKNAIESCARALGIVLSPCFYEIISSVHLYFCFPTKGASIRPIFCCSDFQSPYRKLKKTRFSLVIPFQVFNVFNIIHVPIIYYNTLYTNYIYILYQHKYICKYTYMHRNTDFIYSTTVEFTFSSVLFYFNSLHLCHPSPL